MICVIIVEYVSITWRNGCRRQFISIFRSIEQIQKNDHQYTEEEILQHFNDFYEDLIPELLKFGELRYVLISCNLIPHLRGNVYAIWNTREEGEKALYGLQGRYYGGKEVLIE